jgi:hypothetical protein
MGDGKYAAALETLEHGMLVSTNPAYSSAIADVCAAWAEKIPAGQKDGAAERLRLIQKGLHYAPQQPKLRSLLVQAAQAGDNSAQAAKNLMDQTVASTAGVSAAEWHLFLGQDARLRGDLATARRHVETGKTWNRGCNSFSRWWNCSRTAPNSGMSGAGFWPGSIGTKQRRRTWNLPRKNWPIRWKRGRFWPKCMMPWAKLN